MPRAGGWLDQPLELLTVLQAVDAIQSTVTEKDWTKLTDFQRGLLAWLEADD